MQQRRGLRCAVPGVISGEQNPLTRELLSHGTERRHKERTAATDGNHAYGKGHRRAKVEAL